MKTGHAHVSTRGQDLDQQRAGDVVTITRPDRLARSTAGLPDIARQIAPARQFINEDRKPVAAVARLPGVHRATLWRAPGEPA